MTKFIVTADTYQWAYGTEITLFGIFDTEAEALKFILENPVQSVQGDYNCMDTFDFFKYYEKEKTIKVYREGPNGFKSRKYVGDKTVSKEEYAMRYIQKFDGKPLYLGGYVE
jgi:hypothetical protein